MDKLIEFKRADNGVFYFKVSTVWGPLVVVTSKEDILRVRHDLLNLIKFNWDPNIIAERN